MDELGVHETGKCLFDRPRASTCDYFRENSVNEVREKVEQKNLLANSTNPIVDPKLKELNQNQASVCEDQNDNEDGDLMFKQLRVVLNKDRIVKINMENEGYTLATVDSSRQTVAGSREEWTCRRACLVIAVSAVIGCLLSWTVLIPVFYTSRSSSSDPILNSSVNEMTALQKPWYEPYTDNADHSKPIGRFVLDQQTLMDSGFLRWKGSEQTVGSRVLPSPNESCVVAPEAGLYRVYSQITFAFDGRTHRSEVAHSVLVRTGDDEYMVQKKLISVPFRDPKLSKRHQTMDPSNLITSAKVATDDRICILVSPVGLVYKSQVDNVLMVVKEG